LPLGVVAAGGAQLPLHQCRKTFRRLRQLWFAAATTAGWPPWPA
jgi:hypothetical protein